MSDYKRFTKAGGLDFADKNLSLVNEYGYSHIYNRLAELEDKIENGTLVWLPCKVGTWVYCIAGCFKGFFRRKYVYGVVECPFDITMVDSYKNNWFLTKDEAEARLKELQEENK